MNQILTYSLDAQTVSWPRLQACTQGQGNGITLASDLPGFVNVRWDSGEAPKGWGEERGKGLERVEGWTWFGLWLIWSNEHFLLPYTAVIAFCFLAIWYLTFSANFNGAPAVQESKCRVGADGKYDLYVLARPAMEVAFAGGSGALANGRFQQVGMSLGNTKKRWCVLNVHYIFFIQYTICLHYLHVMYRLIHGFFSFLLSLSLLPTVCYIYIYHEISCLLIAWK